jgi:hypothetical protein
VISINESLARAVAAARSRGMSVEEFSSALIEDRLNSEKIEKHFSEGATFEE